MGQPHIVEESLSPCKRQPLCLLIAFVLLFFVSPTPTIAASTKKNTTKGTPASSTSQPTSQHTPKRPPPPPPNVSTSEPPEGALITKVVIKGLQFLDKEKVKKMLFNQQSGSYSKKILRWDINRLKRTGYFSSIKVQKIYDAGLVTLVFILREQGTWIRGVYFKGNKLLGEEHLRPRLALRAGTPFRREQVEKDAQSIIKLYHSQGYFRTRITVKGSWLKNVQPKQLILWFIIKEGKPARIRRIHLRGNTQVKRSNLIKLLDSRPTNIPDGLLGLFGSRGIYHPSFVARDRYFMSNYYYDHGFMNHRIKGPRIEVSKDRRFVDLTYTIQEGMKYVYGVSAFMGDLIIPRDKLRKMIKYETGDVFNRTQLYQKTIYPILRLYQDAGYAFVRLKPVPQPNAMMGTVNIQYYINKGPLVTVEKVEIKGNKETKDHVIRRAVTLKPGDRYSATKVAYSQRRIFALGMFLPTDQRMGVKVDVVRGSKPNTVVLRFTVREKLTLVLPVPSFSYLPDFEWVFALPIGTTNFMGLGQTLMVRGLVTSRDLLEGAPKYWNIFFYFIDPHFLGSDLYLSLSAYRTYFEPLIAGFARSRLETKLNLSHPVPGWKWARMRLHWRVGQAEISTGGEQDRSRRIAGYEGSWFISSIQLGLDIGSRTFRVGPFRMWSSFQFEHAAPYLGADYTLYKLEATTRWYYHLPNQWIVRAAAIVGWMYSPDIYGTPTFERYFLGGTYNLRGFPLESLSPTRKIPASSDPASSTRSLFWGGNKKIQLHFELQIPLIKSMRLSATIFFDAGNVYDNDALFFQDGERDLPLGMYMNAGVGIRLPLPGQGLFRLECGVPITRREGLDSAFLCNLAIGDPIF